MKLQAKLDEMRLADSQHVGFPGWDLQASGPSIALMQAYNFEFTNQGKPWFTQDIAHCQQMFAAAAEAIDASILCEIQALTEIATEAPTQNSTSCSIVKARYYKHGGVTFNTSNFSDELDSTS